MKKFNSSPRMAFRWIGLALIICGLLNPSRALAGTWTKLVSPAPGVVNLMLLLPDGTVMAANNDGTNFGNAWYRLTPDKHGSYISGSWSNLDSMTYTRLYYSAQVLPNLKVLIAGGEFGTGGNNAELYDIVSGHWSIVTPPDSLAHSNSSGLFSDSESVTLPGGLVLTSPVNDGYKNLIFDPYTTNWSAVSATNVENISEANWVKLADGTILSLQTGYNNNDFKVGVGTNSIRYIPAMGAWIFDASTKVNLWADMEPGDAGETGPALLLPNGNAFFLGGSGHTAIYMPSPLGGTNAGTWAQGPDIPLGLVSADSPAVMMPNGKILCAAAVTPYSTNFLPVYTPPTSFFEFDCTDTTQNPYGSFTQVASPTGGSNDNVINYKTAMLMLPDGNVLYSHEGTDVYVYQPDPPVVPIGKPVINSISPNPDGSFLLTGTGLNGISQGASYGDDLQMDSNYPLVRMTDANNNVIYGRTFNWSSTGVQTGASIVTTEFTAAITNSTYSLVVVANGIASDPVTFSQAVWVDFNYSTNSPQMGTYSQPFSTLAQGVSAVTTNGTISIKPGQSAETLRIATAMKLNAVGGSATIGN
jgi:hypothetical protein